MINLNDLLTKKEKNQLEVKDAKGGLPNSIWETYSAFANSYGGTILLGVIETKKKKLIPVGLNETEVNLLLKNFWDTIHSDKVSINLLTDYHVRIENINNNYILIINVPQASRYDKPIYLNNNLYLCYRRSHEGDYKCTKNEVINMIRDNDVNSQDSYIVEKLTINDLCKDTIEKYRTYFINHKGKEHPFSNEPIELFLKHINAAKLDNNDILRPTKAGLLMFGYNYDIINVYPNYFLDYQDKRNVDDNIHWVNRVYSSSGDWSGNLFDFFFRINNYLVENVKVPFKMDGIFRVDITPIHKAVRELLCNCLSNADYNGTRGLVIKQYNDKLEFSNPGSFLIPKEIAFNGGNSDARNKLILTMFNNINVGERTGSGIPLIFNATKEQGYSTPTFQDFFNPDYTIVTIYLTNVFKSQNKLDIGNDKLDIGNDKLDIGNDKLDIKDDGLIITYEKIKIKHIIKNLDIRSDIKEKLVIIYENFKNDTFSSSSIVELINCSRSSSDNYIKVLRANNLIEPIKGKGKGKYRFKS